ncbi:terminal uridylyltransferase 7-like isoform X2 [Panicum miliaceum]|uniref:Terminal uridylyltransferase 7-like isoform X2 n=1 Tax=Panicum miliaceum TaxID=4540 RepID=A0A3L6RIE4_PANMI|nr:terminal uridylyltransferase 7-like isoform X2 [Panicum miliaceum]
MESKACVIDPALLPTLKGLLLETYASLQPKPVDYENRQVMINVFNKIAEQIFGKKNGLPIVEAFGSFTMDLFTPESDLDLSVNFNTDTKDLYPRKDKINAIRKLTKILYSHQRDGRCYGVLPISTARVPVLKVTDQGTGVECDISIENKDGMSRSMIIKFISSIDERFRILCYLMKFWAKAHDVNSPKDQTMSSMSIISLVAFHLQTRRPPILPAFSAILKDGSDYASIEKNVSLFKGFGSSNKESIAELFVSMMIKLLSVDGLWEQGLCASNFEGSWISKTWGKGVGNLSVEDFLDQSQNFARCVGMGQMRTICECLRATVSDLSKFFMGKIAAPKLKALLFGPLNQGLVDQPQGDFLRLYPGIQLQHQGQAMFGPPPRAAHHPAVLNGLHPYGSIGAQQMQHTDNRLVQRPPYGMRQGFWR